MRILYLNNFRGFSNTFIPLTNINFLIGENSTGKTSILSILKLLSTPHFWSTDDFNINEVELGFFNELISNNVKNISSFELGYYTTEEERTYNMVQCKYENSRGEPILKQLKLHLNETTVLLTYERDYIYVQYKIFKTNNRKTPLSTFKTWISDVTFEKERRYKKNRNTFLGKRNWYSLREIFQDIFSDSRNYIGILRPTFLPPILWFAPIRIKPRRIYETFKLSFSSEGSHTPLLIKTILANQQKKTITRTGFLRTIHSFGKQSGLFDKIEIKSLSRDVTSPFVLNIYLNNLPQKITNVGYGVGQVLPLLTEIITTDNERWLSIQQPEVHLHPKAQAALGEFIFNCAMKRRQNFLIETHSDFLIDRFRLTMKRSNKNISSQILFFERKEGRNIVFPISIEPDGKYGMKQPPAFRSFFINEELKMLTV